MRAGASALAALLVLAGCGSESSQPAAPDTQLTVTVRRDGGAPLQATLSCDPSGGTHPDPQAACAALRANAGALEPVPGDAVCTQIFGGPETATIAGTLDGQRVRASFARTNGCEISRWDRLAPLFRLREP